MLSSSDDTHCIFGQRPAAPGRGASGVPARHSSDLSELATSVSIATSATAGGAAHEHQAIHFRYWTLRLWRGADGRTIHQKGLSHGYAIPHERSRVAPTHAHGQQTVTGPQRRLHYLSSALRPATSLGRRPRFARRSMPCLTIRQPTSTMATACTTAGAFRKAGLLQHRGWFRFHQCARALQSRRRARRTRLLRRSGRRLDSGGNSAPDFGDAHCNLARALSRDGRRREAPRHWTKYLALDHVSTWASRARQERKRLLKLEPLQIVARKIA